MASNIVEFFGYSPADKSAAAKKAREQRLCPFLERRCVKKLRDGSPAGACTLQAAKGEPVICCPIRLYADKYQILRDVSDQAFGSQKTLLSGKQIEKFRHVTPGKDYVVVFGKDWGKELRLPSRSKKSGAYFVDWILAHIDGAGKLLSFVAVEVQSIDTTGNYQAERAAYLKEKPFTGTSTAGFNWENVNKRILPQIIYKGHVLRQEPLCAKGLFFICPTPVYRKIEERLGGAMLPIHQSSGSLTVMYYNIGSPTEAGKIRPLLHGGHFTTTIDQVALAFTAPKNLPAAGVYEEAIRAEL